MDAFSRLRQHLGRQLALCAGWVLLAGVPVDLAMAASGPVIDCTGCEQQPVRNPETGWWYNPDRPGSGLNIEVQGGLVLGSYYGFGADGQPIWYTFSGQPDSSDTARPWAKRLEVPLFRYEAGACADCEYQEPTAVEDGVIDISFIRRNYAEVRIAGAAPQFFVPLLAGAKLVPGSLEVGNYLVPDLGDADYISPGFGNSAWAFVFKREVEVNSELWSRYGGVLHIGPSRLQLGPDGELERIRAAILTRPFVPDVSVVGGIECNADSSEDSPQGTTLTCVLTINSGYSGGDGPGNVRFELPLANIGDSRFEGYNAEFGIRLQAFRIDYD